MRGQGLAERPFVIAWHFIASGFAVGLLVGLTGVGGGSLMTPLLVLLFGFQPRTAVGTDLLYAALTKGVGTAVHGAQRSVDWRIVGRLAAGSLPASIVTIGLLSYFGPASNDLINPVLGGALVLTSLTVFARRPLMRLRGRFHGNALYLTILVGAVIGGLVTVSSVGAGAIGMTALLLLYPETPPAKLVGSDIAHAVPLTFLAGMGHWMTGSVDQALLVTLLIGSIPGIIIGSSVAAKLPAGLLRTIVAIILLLVGGRLLA
jgi:uncharacterized membrane protein YfcA